MRIKIANLCQNSHKTQISKKNCFFTILIRKVGARFMWACGVVSENTATFRVLTKNDAGSIPPFGKNQKKSFGNYEKIRFSAHKKATHSQQALECALLHVYSPSPSRAPGLQVLFINS